jgi:ankyrin repeat protein
MLEEKQKLEIIAAAKSGNLPSLKDAVHKLSFLTEDKFLVRVLKWTIEMNHFDIADWLISQGVNINGSDERQETPLEHAVYWQNIEGLTYLLNHGASVNSASHDGNTILHCAIDTEVENAIARSDEQKKHVPASDTMTRLLVKYGANPNVFNSKGETPLDWSIKRRHKAAEEFLQKITVA